jgi:hypothetical protein
MRHLICGSGLALLVAATAMAALPPGQTLNDAAFGDAAFVSVGANGAIYSSVNSGPWELRASGTTNHLQAVAYGGGMFVAAGANGTLLSSSNGVDWAAAGGGATTVSWSNPDIAYGNGMFVVGTQGAGAVWTMLMSTNGVDWTSVNVDALGPYGVPIPFGGIAFGEGRFLAVGGQYANLLVSSTDGVIWREQGVELPRAQSVMSGPITYGNGKFAMVVNMRVSDDDDDGASYLDQVMLSDEGVHWQSSSFAAGDIPALAAGDCTFVGASTSGISPIWFTHGNFTWTPLGAGAWMPFRAIAYGNGRFVAFGSNIVELAVPGPSGAFVAQPELLETTELGYATFSADPPLCLDGPISYQWRRDGVPIPDTASPYFSIYQLTTNHSGAYTVVATGSGGLSITSTVARLIVTNVIRQSFAPVIIWPTTNYVYQAIAGHNATLNTHWDGWPTPAFQWRFNGANIAGATNSYLTLYNVDDRVEGDYTLVASNSLGVALSGVITVAVVEAAPLLSSYSPFFDVSEGSAVQFPIPANAYGGPLANIYVLRNGTNSLLSLSYFSWFSLQNVTPSDAGQYVFVASNALGMSTGTIATINVIPAGPLDHWVRRNPLPQNDPLLEITYGNGRFVAVGERGSVVVSSNGVDWSAHPLRAQARTRSIAFGNGVFVAGADSSIVTSTDGVTWAARLNRIEASFPTVAFGNGRFVAGAANDVLTSTDGLEWQHAVLPPTVPAYFSAIAFGNGTFVAIGWSAVWKSTDGVTWLRVSTVPTAEVEDIAFGNGLFVVVGEAGAIYTSPDGNTWTSRDSEVSNRLIDVTYGNGRFVAVGTRGRIISSGNGTSWRRENSGAPDRLEGVTFANGVFVAVGENGTILSSPNTTEWTKRSVGVTRDLDGMAMGNGMIVVAGKGGSIVTSSDGSNYVQRTSGTPNDLHGVGWADNLFVAVGEPETIVTSPDGVQWTAAHLSTNSSLKAAAKGNGTWVAVGTGGMLLTSSDGAAWTRRESYTLNDLNSVAYGNGLFVVVGDNLPPNGTMLTSSDGLTWRRRNQYIGKNLRAVAFGNGMFLAAANDSVLISSTNGLDWSIAAAPPVGGYSFNLRGISYANGLWVVVGNEGLVYTSPNGRDWLLRPRQDLDNLHSVINHDGRFVAIGNRGTILQSGPYMPVGPTMGVRLIENRIHLSAAGEAGTRYAFEAAPSLGGPWTPIGEDFLFQTGFTNVGSSDLTATNSGVRFYRAAPR